jgi:hypothetical protein
LNLKLSKYILFSSVFAIFSEAFFINYIIDWKLLYLIIFTNYLGIIYLYKQLKVNQYFFLILIFFLIHGILTYTIIGIPPNFMISQILGIGIVGLYFYNFVLLYKLEEIIKVYLKIVFIVALIGYPLYFLNINLNDGRLQSIFKEPAHYVIVVIPGCYYFLKNKEYFKFFVVFGTLILSSSSLGYIGCALIFLLPNLTLKRIKYLAITLPFLFIAFNYTYKNYEFLQIRVDDTVENLEVVNSGKFNNETNLSSYLIIANAFIMKENVKDHPLGSGIGSHHYMHHNKYIQKVRPPEYLVTLKRHKDNSFDANSLFNRICSEFGFIGLGFILYIIFVTSKVYKLNLYLSQGIFIYFLLKLFRDGTYFPPEMFFFIWLIYFEIKNNKHEL